MASTQNMVKLNIAKSKHHNACSRFLDFHSMYASEVWEWKRGHKWESKLIGKYNELADEVEKTKKALNDIQQFISTRRPYMKAVA